MKKLFNTRDLKFFVGLGLLSTGVGLQYGYEYSLIIAGTLVMTIAFFSEK